MQVSAGARTCVPNATAKVTINSLGPVEVMDVTASGLPANTDFDFFVIQVPKAPFGIARYQDDLEPTRTVFNQKPFPSVSPNPPFGPIQMYHLGLWFNSAADAQKAGCAETITPFNGEHHAGIQVLNTAQFPDDQGPLRQVQ
jgi:hypothetical protein